MADSILVVEDHDDTSAALVQLLSEGGHLVRIAADGQRALDLLDSGFRPGLILIDLMLPHVSGWELLSYLQSDPALRFIPTVVITGVPKDQARVVADAIFHKPLDFSELTAKIAQLLARSSENV